MYGGIDQFPTLSFSINRGAWLRPPPLYPPLATPVNNMQQRTCNRGPPPPPPPLRTALGVIKLFAFMHSFQILVLDVCDFETLCVRKDSHRASTTCKWVCEMNRGIHCESGSSFIVLPVYAGISNWNEECSAFSSLEMPSPPLTAGPIKDVTDVHWMPLFISHTHLHVVLSLWLSFLTHKVLKSPKSETSFEKNAEKGKNEIDLCLQNYTH